MPPNDFQESRQSEYEGPDRRTPQPAHGGVRFDPTINLGHVLTFIGFAVAGFTAWSTLDKRITVIEERASFQTQIDRNQDAVLNSNMLVIKESLGEIKSQVTRVSERLDRRIGQ